GEGGAVKVLDFGLAKAMGDSQPAPSPETPNKEITHTGIILGTAPYMSPEQALGGTVDRRSDIWSFGVVLAEILSGKRLFTGLPRGKFLGGGFAGGPTF